METSGQEGLFKISAHNKRAEYAQPLGHPKRPTSDPIPSNKIRMKPKHIFSDIDIELETSAPAGDPAPQYKQ